MTDVKNQRKRRSLETVLPISRKPKSSRLSMPSKTMAPIKEEEATKKEEQSNVTKRRPLRGRSMFVAPPIAEETEEDPEKSEDSEMPQTKKSDPVKSKVVENLEVAKKGGEEKSKKKNESK